MKTVSILCASTTSVYHTMDGVDVFDINRDCRSFNGKTPIVAHPPCRAWSAFCAHQAKPSPGEKELGLWCCEQLKKCGGVLEQPAHSRLFATAGLPERGKYENGLFTIEVNQSWWGYSMKKSTWLCFSGLGPGSVECPLVLRAADTGDRRRFQVMSKAQRAATVPALRIGL